MLWSSTYGGSVADAWNAENFRAVETLVIAAWQWSACFVTVYDSHSILWRLQSIMASSVPIGCFVPGNAGCQKQVVNCYYIHNIQSKSCDPPYTSDNMHISEKSSLDVIKIQRWLRE